MKIYSTIFKSLIIIALCSVGACKNAKHMDDIPIATVGDKTLYRSELVGVVPKGQSSQDSITIIKSYIDKWIRKELLIQKAELNLTDIEKDVDKEIEEYRSSLLIYRYEQSLVNQKLDTIIHENEIEDYYDNYQENFKLADALVKAVLVKVPLSAPKIDNVEKWLKSTKQEDIRQLEGYCFQYAKTYDYFNNDWVSFSQLLQLVPIEVSDKNQFLNSKRDFQAKDSIFAYIVHIKEYKPSGSIPPLKFVQNNIREIILNKRKLKFINELENNIFTDALSRKQFKIHDLK